MSRQWGPADNARVWNIALPKDPLFFDLGLARIGVDPFPANNEVTTSSAFAYAFIYAKLRASNRPRVDKRDLELSVIGELLAPLIPNAYFCDQETARTRVLNAAKRAFIVELFEEQHAAYPDEFNALEADADQLAWVQAMTFEQAHELLTNLAALYLAQDPGLVTRCVVTMFVGVIRRGTMSDEYRTRTLEALKLEMNITIPLESTTVARLYAQYGQFITAATIGGVIERWRNFLPQSALRLRNMATQASWDGLTTFVQIKEALNAYRDFPWLNLYVLTPYGTEFAAYSRACNLIGDNQYYGYNPDLGEAKSTNYKNLGAVCIALNVAVAGKGTMRQYQGKVRVMAHNAKVKEMIEAYKMRAAAVELDPAADYTDALRVINSAMRHAAHANEDAGDLYHPVLGPAAGAE
nr:MAG: hypothetical protein LiCV1s2_gp2 [Sanya chuvirus 2]